MSSYLVYLETVVKIPNSNDYSLYNYVNKYEIPNHFIGEKCQVTMNNKQYMGTLISWGGGAPPLFYYGKNSAGNEAAKLRQSICLFIRSRLKNICIKPILIVIVYDMNFDFRVTIENNEVYCSIDYLEKYFISEKDYYTPYAITC